MTMTSRPFDVVIAPDFRGEAALTFELRTLFFLATWQAYAGQARTYPLHIACIGAAPPSVRWLAARCNASITQHKPLTIIESGTINTLIGFEIEPQTDQMLLLDTDLFVLGDISELNLLRGSVGVAPAMRNRVPEADWPRIYATLDLPLPSERMPCIFAEVGMQAHLPERFPGQVAEGEAMLPYYQSGSVWLPTACGLGSLWREHMQILAPILNPAEGAVEYADDQMGLTTAVEALRTQGVPVERLPRSYNSFGVQLYGNLLTQQEIKLYHAINFGRPLPAGGEKQTLPSRLLEQYRRMTLGNFFQTFTRQYDGAVKDFYEHCFRPCAEKNLLVDRVQACLPVIEQALQQSE